MRHVEAGLSSAKAEAYRISHIKIGPIYWTQTTFEPSDRWLGIPASTLRGTNHKVWFDLQKDSSKIPFSYEEPSYTVALIDAERVVIHSHDYLYARGVYDSTLDSTPAAERDYALSFPAAAE